MGKGCRQLESYFENEGQSTSRKTQNFIPLWGTYLGAKDNIKDALDDSPRVTFQ